jgi:transposase
MSTEDTSPTIYLGIDVAKDSLQIDAALLPALPSVPNTRAGHQRLLKALLKLKKKGRPHLILEATGGYERPLEDALHDADISFTRIHPKRVRALAEVHGILAKTDALDAQVLTLFGRQIKPAPTARPTRTQRDLSDFSQRRAQLISLLVREKNRLHTHAHPEVIKEAEQTITLLQQQIEQWDARILKLGEHDPVLKDKVHRLSQLQGVAATTAHGVLAAMPELGTMNRQQVAALAGLAPRNRDSGNVKGKRTIGGGRATARRALYMAAVSASRCNPVLKPFYQRMISAGKPPKTALTAVMRKLLTTMNKMIKDPNFTLA